MKISVPLSIFFLDAISKCKDLSDFVDHLPVTTDTKIQIYNVMLKMINGSSSIVNIILELKQIQIIPHIENAPESSFDEIRQNAQRNLNKVFDDCWSVINEENASEFHELCQKTREIFNSLFSILDKQQNEISHLKCQMEMFQIPQDELLLGSVATQIIIKMSRFQQIMEDPRLTACRTMSMVMADPHIEQLKAFLGEHGYNIEEMRLAIQVLKSNRIAAAHPSDPTTTSPEIQTAIDRLFSSSHPKRPIALKALKVLELLAEELNETLFLKAD